MSTNTTVEQCIDRIYSGVKPQPTISQARLMATAYVATVQATREAPDATLELVQATCRLVCETCGYDPVGIAITCGPAFKVQM
jgi:hypothetical protein